MAGILAYEDAVDIGGGRGRLAAPAAASLARVDRAFRSAFGRAADINEAWRSPQQADKNFRAYQAWLAYQAGRGPKVPWAPIGYAAKDSIHCRGFAVDTDDTSAAQMRIWNDHGWFWTVYRNGVLVERWHLEYDASRDNHRNDPVGATTAPPVSEEDDMLTLKIDAGPGGVHLCTLTTGVFSHMIEADNPEWIKNVVRSDDKWDDVPIGRLPALLRRFGCDLHIWDIRNGAFVVLDPLTGQATPGGMWSAVNAARSAIDQVKVTSAETAAYIAELAS